jgi:putative FmdB family regulatory protein
MPIYEYICEDCGHEFDALRSMKDADSEIACQQCESHHTHRMLSLFFAQSNGQPVTASTSSGCANCSGGSCASCRN